jgi:hypothetical protein
MRYWLARLLVKVSSPEARGELEHLLEEAAALDHRFVLDDARKMLDSL